MKEVIIENNCDECMYKDSPWCDECRTEGYIYLLLTKPEECKYHCGLSMCANHNVKIKYRISHCIAKFDEYCPYYTPKTKKK